MANVFAILLWQMFQPTCLHARTTVFVDVLKKVQDNNYLAIFLANLLAGTLLLIVHATNARAVVAGAAHLYTYIHYVCVCVYV